MEKSIQEVDSFIREAYQQQTERMEKLEQVEVSLYKAKNEFYDAKEAILLKNLNDIKVLGANEELRMANINSQIKSQIEKVRNLEIEQMEIRFAVERSKQDIDYAKMIMRSLEYQKN